MIPPAIESVTTEAEVTDSFLVLGIALTSQGNLAMVEYAGPRAALYTDNLEHIMTVYVTGAIGLQDVTCSEGMLFMTDFSGYTIHVMREDGSYIHNISTTWGPMGIDFHENYLFVTDNTGSKLYKIELDQAFNRLGQDLVILDEGPLNGKPVLSNPNFVYIHGGKILVSNRFSVLCSNVSGGMEWITKTVPNPHGTGPGEFNWPMGMQVDNWGRIIVADRINHRIQLLSANGSFIKYLTTGMYGRPTGIVLVKNILYVAMIYDHKLAKYTLNYT